MFIEYRLVFDQSWRIGSGEAAGRFLDDLVRRDGCELPFVPGSTLRGLVGDALGKLAGPLRLELCQGTAARPPGGGLPGPLCGVTRRESACPRCAIVGSPHREGRTRWGPARLMIEDAAGAVEEPDRRRALAREARAVPELLTRPHPHTSIDRASGRAADERLFTLEEVPSDFAFAGRVEMDPALDSPDVALLVAALRFVRELGGSRRRGLGRCRFHITAAALAPAFASWEEAIRSLAGSAPAGAAKAGAASRQELTAEGRVRSARPSARRGAAATLLQVDATVIGEVVAGARPETGNLIPGLPWVPGSTLRGALAARWREDRRGEAFRRCFLSGAVRFGFLYPREGERTAPPRSSSIYSCKLQPGRLGSFGHGLVDLLLDPDAERCPQEGCSARLAPWRQLGGSEGTDSPSLQLSPHNRIDPSSQTVREGGLFAYEAISEGTSLRGFIRADDPRDLEALLEGVGLAEGEGFTLRAGRRRGCLGHLECVLSGFEGRDGGVGLFPDGEVVPATVPPGGAVRIDLLTPAVVMDPHLRFRESLLPPDLGLARGRFDGAFTGTEVIAGWHSAHRLPKADQVAVAAGSSFLLKGLGPEELKILRPAALLGVGLRREEGFGAFAVSAVDPAVSRR